MYNNITRIIIFLGLALAIKASPPNIEPFDVVFERFATTYVLQCEEILRELPVSYSGKDKDFEGLTKYLNNIKEDDIAGVRRLIKENDDDVFDLPYWLRRLNTDIIGFRRVLDHLIIINLSNDNLKLSEQYKNKLEKYWKDERYYSWRFNHEAYVIDLRTKLTAQSNKGNNTSSTKADANQVKTATQ